MTEDKVREMTLADIDPVARVHTQSFEGFFLTFLGENFLRLYYRSIVEYNQIGFVALDGATVVGLVTGIDNRSGFYKRCLRRRGLAFAAAAIPAAIRQPGKVLPRLLGALNKKPSGPPRQSLPAISLTSIAVLPSAGGHGLGHALVEAFKRQAAARGVDRIYLETDAHDNARTIAFYEREGFSLSRTYTTKQGRQLHEYAFDLRSTKAHS